MRRFARSLGVHHSSLSRLLRSRSAIAHHTVYRLGGRLDLSEAELARFAQSEAEHALRRVLRRPDFTPNVRFIASAACLPMDLVQIAIQSLLRQGRLQMIRRDVWVIREALGT